MKAIILIYILSVYSITTYAGDPVRGKSKSLLCIGCHGIDGNNSNSTYPILAGQGELYLVKQLNDFKTGLRKEEHMSSMVEALSYQDIPDVASYFSSQERRVSTLTNAYTDKGKFIYFNGIASKAVTACAACHALNGLGNNAAKFPVVAGQHSNYVIKTLSEFRSKKRHNDPDNIMRNIAVDLTDSEIKAVADYISLMSM